MESALDLVRSKKQPATSELIDVLFVAAEQLETMVEDISRGGKGKLDVTETVNRLKRFIQPNDVQVETNVLPTTQQNFECDVYSKALSNNRLQQAIKHTCYQSNYQLMSS